MTELWTMISANIAYFPLAALVCLLLAGFSLPFSEDLIIITGALICAETPGLLVPSLAAIYTGVFASDIIAYWIGCRIRTGAEKSRFSAKLIKPRQLESLKRHLDKNGLLTFIVFRFIPFGVRNTLFIGSGMLGLRFRLFLAYDLIAGALSTNALFFLVYHFGEDIKKPFKTTGIVLFILLIIAVTLFSVFYQIKKRRRRIRERKIASSKDTSL